MNGKQIILAAALCGIALSAGFVLTSCSKSGQHEKDPGIAYYTCPMHPQIHQDHPGECPICHMTLVPVYKETSPPTPSPESGEGVPEAGVRISPDRQHLIGLKTAKAVRKPLSQEIRTVGRVAFDPGLAVAQREYLEIAKSVPSLKDAARSNLRLKGMSDEEIRALDRVGQTLFLPGPGDSVWVYATLYQGELDAVSPGVEATVTLPSGSGQIFKGAVRAVDPVLDPMTRSARARIEVPGAGGVLRPDTYVNVSIPVAVDAAIVIPKSAVIDTGTRKIAFVVHDGQRFETRELTTGPETSDEIVVLKGIGEGETVAASAAFLIDSESQLKAAVSGMGGHSH